MSETAFHKTNCSQCNLRVEYPAHAESQTAPCPTCGASIVLVNVQSKMSKAGRDPESKAPLFVVEPDDAVIQKGEFVFFKAKAKGVPSPTYQWFKVEQNGKEKLQPGEIGPEFTPPNGTIGVSTYFVRATNSSGYVYSRLVTLSVQPNNKYISAGKPPTTNTAQSNVRPLEIIAVPTQNLGAAQAQRGAPTVSPVKSASAGDVAVRIVAGIVIGAIIALAIFATCLLARKVGWNRFGDFVALICSKMLYMGVWEFSLFLVMLMFINELVFRPKTQAFGTALKANALQNSFTISCMVLLVLVMKFFYHESTAGRLEPQIQFCEDIEIKSPDAFNFPYLNELYVKCSILAKALPPDSTEHEVFQPTLYSIAVYWNALDTYNEALASEEKIIQYGTPGSMAEINERIEMDKAPVDAAYHSLKERCQITANVLKRIEMAE